MKVLICEDHQVEMKVIQVALADHNIQWFCASDGKKALKLLEEHKDFDMVITDIHMPFYNGDDILRVVREEQNSSVPVIMISSDDQEEVVRLALKLGVNEFIEKPIDPVKVKKTLKKYLR